MAEYNPAVMSSNKANFNNGDDFVRTVHQVQDSEQARRTANKIGEDIGLVAGHVNGQGNDDAGTTTVDGQQDNNGISNVNDATQRASEALLDNGGPKTTVREIFQGLLQNYDGGNDGINTGTTVGGAENGVKTGGTEVQVDGNDADTTAVDGQQENFGINNGAEQGASGTLLDDGKTTIHGIFQGFFGNNDGGNGINTGTIGTEVQIDSAVGIHLDGTGTAENSVGGE